MVAFLIDPLKQINKGKDAQRREDFTQIRNALDTYYNDFSCYPSEIPFGQEWRVNNTVYMKKVPQDPSCSASTICYSYVYDETSACPQWNVLFGKLVIAPPPDSPACQLQTECLPINYVSEGFNFCNFGGNIDCDYIAATILDAPLVTPSSTPSLSPTPSLGPSENPSPTTIQEDTGAFYYCACGSNHQTGCTVTYNPPINVQYYTEPSCNSSCGLPC